MKAVLEFFTTSWIMPGYNSNIIALLPIFWLREVSFLGHVILKGGIAVDPSKVEAVMQWESSKSVF